MVDNDNLRRRAGAGAYYVDDECCGHYENFRDMQLALAGRGGHHHHHHHRCESLAVADTGPPPPYHRHRAYLGPPDCRCCPPTPGRDPYYDQYAAGEVYDRHHPYGPAPPLPARTPVLDARRQAPYVEGWMADLRHCCTL